MTRTAPQIILSILLVLSIVLTILPTTAFAAETEDRLAETTAVSVQTTQSPGGTIGYSGVTWELDTTTGQLVIAGSGDCETFQSADDQPWALYRDEISNVWFCDMQMLEISNLAHWFEGCTALKTAEIPYTTLQIGECAFAGCSALERVFFYYMDEQFSITPGAFAVENQRELEIAVLPDAVEAINTLTAYNWTADNRVIYLADVCGTALVDSGYCINCDTTCPYTIAYERWTAKLHCIRQWCSNCGDDQAGGTLGEAHTYNFGTWAKYSNSQHRRTNTCTLCGYSTYEYANHSLIYGAWAIYSDEQHTRTISCACGYRIEGFADHADTDDDGYCDDCEYLMTRFSVTVPAAIRLTVSERGEVYAADNAQIVNNSTDAVEITAITLTAENGWSIVPYATNMANAKVDAKQIGFRINDAETVSNGSAENLAVGNGWTIAEGDDLPLDYDATVSATSEPISEQVLTIVFIVDWAA